eukprot:8252116-Alexandrium_andersonii.AAC.1
MGCNPGVVALPVISCDSHRGCRPPDHPLPPGGPTGGRAQPKSASGAGRRRHFQGGPGGR